MFLTRKAQNAINWLTVAYCVLGALFLMLAGLSSWDDDSWALVRVGIFAIAFGVILRPVMRYSLGTNKLLLSANKLVYKQLRPAEFIRLYTQKRDCPDNVVAKPDFSVLNLLTVAYDVLDDSEHALQTLEQMLSIAPEKKKAHAMLLKASLLYDQGRLEEAERLYREVRNRKTDALTKATADVVLKTDRAMAMGDYATAEDYFRQMLAQAFPKHPPLSLLTAYYHLGKLCALTNRPEEAKEHLTYCIENGGETAMKTKAAALLSALQP